MAGLPDVARTEARLPAVVRVRPLIRSAAGWHIPARRSQYLPLEQPAVSPLHDQAPDGPCGPAGYDAVMPPQRQPATVFERLGQLAYRRRWLMIDAWAGLLAIALPLAPRASGALHAGGFNLPDLESARARAVLHNELGLPESALVLVYSSSATQAGQAAFEAATAAARRAIAGAPYVAQVLSYEFAPDQVSRSGG